MTKRAEIKEKLKAVFSAIQIRNGYSSDLGLNMQADRTSAFEEEELPGGSFSVTGTRTKRPQGRNFHEHELDIEVTAYLQEGEATADKADEIEADIRKAFGVDPSLGKLISKPDATEVESNVEISEEKKVTSRITMRFTVVYMTDLWQV